MYLATHNEDVAPLLLPLAVLSFQPAYQLSQRSV
jgi:hypothetical protein